jgi:hypothetical protein
MLASPTWRPTFAVELLNATKKTAGLNQCTRNSDPREPNTAGLPQKGQPLLDLSPKKDAFAGAETIGSNPRRVKFSPRSHMLAFFCQI